MMLNYKPEDINWEQVNDKILETSKKVVGVGQTSLDHKMMLKIIYDEKAYENLFAESSKNGQSSKKLLSVFSCIEKLHSNVLDNIDVKSHVDYITVKLLDTHHLGQNDNLYALCINNSSKKFQSRYKCRNKDPRVFDFNNVCIPNTTGENGTRWQLRTMCDLYFNEESITKRVSYFASLLINIQNFYNFEVSQFLVFEGRDSSILAQENQDTIREIFKGYNAKTRGEAGASSGKKITEIIFYNINIQDYIKL